MGLGRQGHLTSIIPRNYSLEQGLTQLAFLMHSFMAFGAQRDQVLFLVAT